MNFYYCYFFNLSPFLGKGISDLRTNCFYNFFIRLSYQTFCRAAGLVLTLIISLSPIAVKAQDTTGDNYITNPNATVESIGKGVAKPWQMHLDAGSSIISQEIAFFHNYIMMPLIIFICLFVLTLLVIVMVRFSEKKNPVPSKVSHNTMLEIIWTAVPLIILAIMFIPSIKILYQMESRDKSDLVVKVTANQWFWNYEYSDLGQYGDGVTIKFDSLMVPKDALRQDEKSLYTLKTDRPLFLPVNKRVKIILTSADVIHSFSVIKLGLKMDAIPGRNNETWVTVLEPGVYYGFCTELCGTGHAFMPIEIHAVTEDEFTNWVSRGGVVPSQPLVQTGKNNGQYHAKKL